MDSNLKIPVTVFILLILPIALLAQKVVTRFLGIPVDGTRIEMVDKLKSKGFTISPDNKEVLCGEFNGINVNIHIVTNNNKVCRIMICDVNKLSEGNIKIRFNKLCQQFENNKKYMAASSAANYKLSDEENISYELSVHKKRYEATYYQLPSVVDSVANAKELQAFLLSKYSIDQLSNQTEELQEDMLTKVTSYLLDIYSKKLVWFMITEYKGEYYITMFYDNEYNRAKGDDL